VVALWGPTAALYISLSFLFLLWVVYFDPLSRQIARPHLTIFHRIETPWARDSLSSALPVPHRISSKQMLFFVVPLTIAFSVLCVYRRSKLTT